MSASLTVPLSRQGPVSPGEEVDVAVDLVAPQEHGRYVGYWRLTGPMGRKKWGQRVWAHIHVVDPQAEPQPPTEKEMREMQAATSSHGSCDNDDGGEMVIVPKPEAEAEAIVSAMSAATVNDAPSPGGPDPDAAPSTPPPSDETMAEAEAVPKGAAVLVAESLGQMGFADAELVQFVVERNGPDLDACVNDLA